MDNIDEMDAWVAWEDGETDQLPAGWEMVASFDHGLRCADETMVLEVATVGMLIMGPVLDWLVPGGKWDAWAAACEAVGGGYDGGWVLATEDDPHAERVHWLHQDIVDYQTWGSVEGIYWHANGDCGMTWFSAKVER